MLHHCTGLNFRRRGFLLPLPHPLLLIFCSRPIFRAGKTPKTLFFALCSSETLATQATINSITRSRNTSAFHKSSKARILASFHTRTSTARNVRTASQHCRSNFKDLLRETQSYNIDESVWFNYVFNIYAKWNLFIKSLLKLLINLLHQKN